MTLIKGIKIILFNKIKTGENPFGEDIYKEVEIEVDNVLISPIQTEDVINQLDLTGRKAVYTLAIPKGDKNTWENQTVKFFGEKWKVIGKPLQGIEELIPLDWNKKVMVERYE